MVITRSQNSVAASTAAVLKCTCKINKQPKSSTRSRPVNKTSKRAPSPSPSPSNPIHRSRSKLSKKILEQCDKLNKEFQGLMENYQETIDKDKQQFEKLKGNLSKENDQHFKSVDIFKT